jgi:hypothetical protein
MPSSIGPGGGRLSQPQEAADGEIPFDIRCRSLVKLPGGSGGTRPSGQVAGERSEVMPGQPYLNERACRRYPQYDKPEEFTAAEVDAREHRRGLRADPNPVPPWEWRRAKRQASTSH